MVLWLWVSTSVAAVRGLDMSLGSPEFSELLCFGACFAPKLPVKIRKVGI